jgi:hypothetical protein
MSGSLRPINLGVPDITVVVRENSDANKVLVDVPNISVNIETSPDYKVSVQPSSLVVQRTGSLPSLAVSALFANTASYALAVSGSIDNAISASFATTASYALNAITTLPVGVVSSSGQINTGSFTGSFTGVLIGTSSYANNANLLDGLDSSVFATTGSNQFNGNQTIIGSVTSSRVLTDAVRFNTSAGVSVGVGELAWNNSDGTLDLGMKGGNVVQQIGQELFYEVRNETGIEIPNGTAVYANGVTAGSARITASPYTADGSVREVRFLGIATEDISNGVNGFVTHFGYVRGLDTRGTTASSIAVGDETWAVGDILYVHPTVAGKLTNVKPEHAITVAIIITRHQSVGVLFVRPSSGGHLEDIHDILINTGSLTNGQVLSYNSTSGLWENTNQINTSSFATTGSNQFNGNQTITGSLIQGLGNTATGENSHAEGDSTQAIGLFSHAEGLGTIAYGGRSHAEGQDTIASGSYSHAEGYQTIALADHQHVQGQWNAVSSVPAAFIVGNGTDDSNRSNLIYAAGNEVQITGSLNVKNGITGSLFGTSSQAITASFALTASYVASAASTWDTISNKPSGLVSSSLQINTGSFTGSFTGTLIGTASWASNVISSSFATTASFALNASAAAAAGTVSSSLQFNSLTLPFTGSFTGSLIGTVTSASFATSASYAPGGGTTFPYIGTAVISGSLIVSSSVTASAFKGDGSQLTNLPSGLVVIDSYTFVGNGSVSNYTLSNVYDISSLIVTVGGLTQTSIIDYTLAGTNLSFLVAPASQSNILVRAVVNASTGAVGSFTGSLLGTASFATTASFALSASYAPGGGTTFPYTGTAVISGSLIVSSSVTASAFKGDGSQLTNLPSSSVVIDSYTFTGNGAVSNYTLNNVYDISSLTVVVGGLTQTSIIDYTLAGTNLSFLVAPPSQSNILVRALVNTSVGVVGSFTGSFTGDGTGLTGVTATVFPYVGAAVISGSLTITGSNALNITGSATILGAFQATTKSFKIDHQRLLGKKLIYGVLEGPEHGVYVRGRLTKNNIIQLPEEWEWLVDSDSITVQLTPIAIQQALYVQNIENNTVIINSSTPIDCFYYVQATRKDVNTLQTVE